MNSFTVIIAFVAVISACINAMTCPTSDSKMHAGCEVSIEFVDECTTVKKEIEARIFGQYETWHDPHNNGTYSLTSQDDSQFSISRVTGDLKYTDKMIFTFTNNVHDGCTVGACSQSQVFSIGDYSTNFCNLHDLYCSDAGCHPFTTLSYTEAVGTCTEASPSKCLVV